LKKNKKPKYYLIVFALLILGFGLTRMIKINEIVCESQYDICNDLINKKLDTLKGIRMYKVKKQLKNSFSEGELVSKYSYQYQIPDKLRVNVIESKSIIALFDESSNIYYLLDRDNKVLEIVQTTQLPYILISNEIFNVGDYVGDGNAMALDIFSDLNYLYQISYAKISDNSFIVKIPDNIEIIFPLEGDKKMLMGAFNLIMNKINQHSPEIFDKIQTVNTIDLRFDNPVIR